MKLRFFTTLLFLSSFVFAQNDFSQLKPQKKWRFNAIGLSVGGTNDTYGDMDMDYIRSFGNRSQLTEIDLSEFEESAYAQVAGGRVGLEISLVTGADYESNRKGWQKELLLGVDVEFDREAMVDFSSTTDQPYSSSNIIYCVINNVVNFNASYLVKLNSFSRFSPYVGIGGSVGKTFNNQFIFLNGTDRSYEGETGNYFGDTKMDATESSIFYRVIIPVGIDYNFGKNMSIGINSRIGMGVEKVRKGNSYFVPSNFQLGLSVKRYFSFHKRRSII